MSGGSAGPVGDGFMDPSALLPTGGEPVAEAGARSRVRWPRLDGIARREILLALALLFCYGFFQQVPAWNEYSRYDLVRALVEDGTTRIDRFEQNTGDKAFYDGHFYSDKAPGTALIGVPVYALLSLASQAAGDGSPDPQGAVQGLAFVESGVATVLLVLLLLRFLRPRVGESWALVVAVGYGLGSIAFPFATMFFGHATSALLLFSAFYLLSRWRSEGGDRRPLLAGLLAGCAVVTEVPVVLGVAVLGVYALWLGRGVAARFVLGGIPALVVLMAYDWLTFGGPFDLGYQYATVFGAQNSQGILSVVWPSPASAVDLITGPRGLIRLAPWFIAAPLGVLAARSRDLRPEVAVCVAICAAFLVYNSGALNPFGGWTPGPRYLLPALPFAAILAALAPRVLRPLVATLIAISVAIFFVATATMPNAQELYADPLYQLWLPRFLSGDLAQTIAWLKWGLGGFQALIPLAVALAIAAAGFAATFRSGGVARRLTGLAIGSLVLLVVAFAVPFWPQSALTVAGAQGRPVGTFTLAAAGATPMRTGSVDRIRIWAQLENAGAALDGTRVMFTVFTPQGKRSWSGGFGDVGWSAGERKRLAVEWDTSRVEPGDYPFEISVASRDGRVTYLDAAGLGAVRVQ